MTGTDVVLLIFIVVLMVPVIMVVRSLMKDTAGSAFSLDDTVRPRDDYLSADFTSIDVNNVNKHSMLQLGNNDTFTRM